MKNRIFIVEDSEVVKSLLKHTINQNLTAEVRCISLPENLFSEMIAFQPDIIILDYHLRFDGIDLNAEDILKGINQRLPHTSTIIFSGQKDKEIAVKLLNLGAINYVSKDDDTFHDKILMAVEEAIEYRESSRYIRDKRAEISRSLKWLAVSLMITVAFIALGTIFS